MFIHTLRQEYEANQQTLGRLARWAEAHLASLLDDPALDLHQVSARVKTEASLLAKATRPDRIYANVLDVTDLVGVRVTTYFEDGIARIQRLIEDRFEVDYRHSMDKGEGLGASRFGYRSVHVVCLAPDMFSWQGEGGPGPIPFEIQIRTVLQHAWAQIEHDLGYKTAEAVPQRIRRKFSRLASLLEIADEGFVQIRSELSRYEEAVRQREGADWRELDIDKVSLGHMVRRGRVMELDRRLARLMDRELVDEPFHQEYLVRVLLASGLSTLEGIEQAFARLEPELPGFVEAYFRFTEEQWDFGPPRVRNIRRGYCLLFVAYFHLLRAETPGVPRLEAATRFLQITDRMPLPEAREAARRLLSAFGER